MHFRPKLLIFDLNGTLLDLKPIKAAISNALANEHAFDTWSNTLLHYSMAETLTSRYQNFGAIAVAALKMTAERFEKQISEGKISDIVGLLKKLPPHADVIEALTLIKKTGIKMTVLTNGNLETAKAQLAYAEIDHFFGEIFSVESVRIYKPHPAPYSHVVKEMKASPIYSMLLSAHAWDLMGAQRTGLMTGFVQRPGKGTYPLMERPTLTGTSLISMAQTLVGA